jgi:hypothetical protein
VNATLLTYRAQRAFVATMFDALARLLVAASATDHEVARELAGFPEGYTIGFSVLGDETRLRLRVRGGRLERVRDVPSPDLNVIFKHISHAFLVLSFQESSPRAYANQRMVTQGDIALSMRFSRCLDRTQAISLPRFIVVRALKEVPALSLGEKLSHAMRVYLRVAGGLTLRSRT